MSYLRLVNRPQKTIKVSAEEAYQHALQFMKRIEQMLMEARNREERQIALAQHKQARVALKAAVNRLGEPK